MQLTDTQKIEKILCSSVLFSCMFTVHWCSQLQQWLLWCDLVTSPLVSVVFLDRTAHQPKLQTPPRSKIQNSIRPYLDEKSALSELAWAWLRRYGLVILGSRPYQARPDFVSLRLFSTTLPLPSTSELFHEFCTSLCFHFIWINKSHS